MAAEDIQEGDFVIDYRGEVSELFSRLALPELSRCR